MYTLYTWVYTRDIKNKTKQGRKQQGGRPPPPFLALTVHRQRSRDQGRQQQGAPWPLKKAK